MAGQTATVLWVSLGLQVALPLQAAWGVLGFTALTNVLLHFAPAERGETPAFLGSVLTLDVVLLTVLLQLTGGPYNPFATLYLVLVALAAVALTPRWTWIIAGLSGLGYGWLFLASSLPARLGDPICGVGPNLPMGLHLGGMVVAFAVTAGLVAFFGARLQLVLQRQQVELAQVRDQAAHHERFAALATLAAGAAHELGTPLGSIVVAAGELAREAKAIPSRPGLLDDAELIRREAFRCRAILDRLQNHAEDVPQVIDPVRLVESLLVRFPGVRFEREGKHSPARVVAPPEALVQALTNLVGNALDASPAGREVRVGLRETARHLEFVVTDEGPGLSEPARAHAGEPFFTTKPAGRGMGLGLFLVRLLARRLAGEFRFERPSEGGTRAILSLPMAAGGRLV